MKTHNLADNIKQVSSHPLNIGQLLKIYRIEAYYEWLKTIRNPSFSLPAILFPVVFYVFFGVLLNHGNAQAASYLLCTYGVFGVMGPALFSFGAGLAIERGQGWLDIKQASPMPAGAQIFARLWVAMTFSVLIVLSLSLVAVSLAGVSLSLLQWLSLIVIWVLGGIPFCLLGLSLGLVLKAQSAPALINLVYLPLAFMSGLWMPITILPSFLQDFAQFLPPYHLAQLALKVVGLDQGQALWQHVIVLLAYTFLFALLSLTAHRRSHA
jgi:ABC-2 type transport system permease protein